MSDFESFEQERSDARESDAALPRDPQPVPPADGSEPETYELPTVEDHEGAAEGEPLRPRDWQGDTREILEGLAHEHTDERGTESPNSHADVGREDVAAAQPPSRRKERRLVERRTTRPAFTLEQRLLILDAWRRCALPGSEFAPLVGIAPHTLYLWRRAFEREGPAGLVQHRRGAPSGSRLPEVTKRAILLIKQDHPEWGCQRISGLLLRGPALAASASAVARVLHEAGYELEDVPTRPHPPQLHRFERARPNQLWQTDLFSFILKRHNRRVYLVAFLDDHSRFIVSFGLYTSQTAALVIEVLRAGIACYGLPQEILTDNGSQYVTWRGKSAFSRELEKLGIRQVVSARKHPQTLGKIERFWKTLWRECLQSAIFQDLADARRRIGLFMDHYNFQRTHLGIEGLVPADRFFGAASEVARTLRARVAANALELARHGVPRAPFYLTGQLGGKGFSIHAAGERVILTDPQGVQHEIDVAPQPDAHAPTPLPSVTPPPAAGETACHVPSMPDPVCLHAAPGEDSQAAEESDLTPPGTSPLDEQLKRLAQGLGRQAADPAGESPSDGDTDSRNSDRSGPGGGQ